MSMIGLIAHFGECCPTVFPRDAMIMIEQILGYGCNRGGAFCFQGDAIFLGGCALGFNLGALALGYPFYFL